MTRILIVDDRPINRQFLMTLLRYRGFETREADDGRQALEVMRDWLPVLAIIDIAMPVMNGIELVQRMHATPELAAIPVIFYTASYDAAEAARIAADCGVTEFLMKPSEPELILETIERSLGRAAPRVWSDVADAAAAEFVRLHSDALRMSALVDFQLELGAQREPDAILNILARAALNVIPSEHSIVTLNGRTFSALREPPAPSSVVNSLSVPVETVSVHYGSLSLRNRQHADRYSPQDERIAQTIAAQAAISYENLLLYEQLRQEAEEMGRVARDRELLLESTGEGICAVDREGRCTMVNRVATKLFGWSAEELIGRRAHELVHDHVSDCAVARAITTGAQSRVTGESFRRKDGSSFPVEYTASPIVDGGMVRGAVVTFFDVTERLRLEQHLEQVERISSLGRVAATVAHEFNNVLMGIQPFAEVVRRRAGDDAKLQQASTQILAAVSRGRNITQDIMRMTKMPEPALQPVDVSEWLEQLGSEVRGLVGKIDVIVESPAPGHLFAACDPAQIHQVLMNLAVNARDAMNGRGTLTISACGAEGQIVRVEVTDTGGGIPPEARPFIFEPLFTTKRSGTGLGLAVAQQLVVQNGGTITVASSDEQGTRFRIDLLAVTPVRAGASTPELSRQRGS